MEILARLFGGDIKLKLIRLFLFSPEQAFDAEDIAKRLRSNKSNIKRELGQLRKMKFVKSKRVIRLVKNKKKTFPGFVLDPSFPYLVSLKNFLVGIEPLQPKEITKKFTKLGSIKALIISGIFIQEPESRLDLLLVGDGVKTGSLDATIKNIEAEIGKELRYAYFTTEDFKYRLSMYDKLTRDVLDYPHKLVLDKLGLSEA